MTVDLRSQKINLEKIFDDPKAVEKHSDIVQAIKAKFEGFVTLLDLAEEYLLNQELKDKLPVPMYIIEESKIVPYIKQRFYSVVNDPFPNGAEKTQRLEFAFSLTKFEK